jgi:putative transcriptional regulator
MPGVRKHREELIHTKYRVLVEVAAKQPNVRQADIAARLGITPQAVSEYIKQLLKDGHISSEGPLNYRVTTTGVEEILRGAQEIKEYSRFVLDEVVRDVRVFTAIAANDLKEGQRVALWMRDGLLYAGENPRSRATGVVVRAVSEGHDVGVTDLRGIIELETGMVTICQIHRVERGGSRGVDYGKLRKKVRGRKYVGALGVEALVALREIKRKPDAFYGVIEAVVDASHHGLSPLVVGVDKELPEMLRRLEEEGIPFNVVDVSLESGS